MIDQLWSDQRGTIGLGLERESSCLQAVLAWSWGSVASWPPLAATTFLTGPELAYWDRLVFPGRRLSYLLGRDAAKQAVAAFSGIADPRTFEVAAGVFHQPVVRGASFLPIGVSIAHCDAVACAVAFPDEHPMAIDVEPVNDHRAAVMERELTSREIRALEAIGCGAIVARVVGWTAKEALSKALRCGLTCPCSLLAVARVVAAEGRVAGEFENFGQYRFESWIRQGLVLTLVLPRRTRLVVQPAGALQAAPTRLAPVLRLHEQGAV
ncbi:MAG: 4'-phosphopantetheinyl transferase superfamily protein [Verrucomicrobia bacterium]|nr:4'-phosphopantetheinyl transferase superfamily protein [Verrucomicrobiota bacterium]